jgi:hypothetical protein
VADDETSADDAKMLIGGDGAAIGMSHPCRRNVAWETRADQPVLPWQIQTLPLVLSQQ